MLEGSLRSRTLHILPHTIGEGIEIGQALLKDGINLRIVDACVLVDEEIAKARHVQKRRQHAVGYDVRLDKNAKDVLVVSRIAQPLQRDDASPNIQTDLDSDL